MKYMPKSILMIQLFMQYIKIKMLLQSNSKIVLEVSNYDAISTKCSYLLNKNCLEIMTIGTRQNISNINDINIIIDNKIMNISQM